MVSDPGITVDAATPGSIFADTNFNRSTGPDDPWIHLGGGTGYVGVRFYASTNADSLSGTYQWVHLIEELCRRKSGSGQWEKMSGGGLDGEYAYPPHPSSPTKAADSPGLRLWPDKKEESVTHTGHMHLMWKPNDGIWVNVWKTDWMWFGHATNATSWLLIETDKTNRIDFNGIFRNYPSWNRNVNENEWVPE